MRLMAISGLMAGDRFEEITAEARSLVARDEGDTLMVVPGWWNVISATTYVEFLEHSPDILEFAGSIPCPTLFVRDRPNRRICIQRRAWPSGRHTPSTSRCWTWVAATTPGTRIGSPTR